VVIYDFEQNSLLRLSSISYIKLVKPFQLEWYCNKMLCLTRTYWTYNLLRISHLQLTSAKKKVYSCGIGCTMNTSWIGFMSFVRTFCQIYYYFHTQEPLFYSPTFITPTLRTPCDHQHLASQRVKTFFIFVNKTHLSIVYILTLTATIFDLSLFILPSRRFAIAGQLPHLYLATPLAVTP